MAFELFTNENVAHKLPKNGAFQVGVSDLDPPGSPVERGIFLPTTDALASWVYYDVQIICVLDSGIVVHRHLPQDDPEPATLASCYIDDPSIDKITGRGVNLKSKERYADIVQRMAHGVYYFRLFGQAMRIGEQIPIPGMKTVGGVDAIPHDNTQQWAYNKLVGNYYGIPLWYAQWSLWYTVAEPPTKDQTPPPNLAQHLSGDAKLPKGAQAPFSVPDDEAVSAQPPDLDLQTPLG